MKMVLRITKGGSSLCTGTYEVNDAQSFGAACADAWSKMMQQQFRKESSVGSLMENLEANPNPLEGALISIEQAL